MVQLFFFNPAVTLSLKLVEGSPVCIRDDMSEGYTQKAGGWVQPLVDKGAGERLENSRLSSSLSRLTAGSLDGALAATYRKRKWRRD